MVLGLGFRLGFRAVLLGGLGSRGFRGLGFRNLGGLGFRRPGVQGLAF